jgi:hypothetical protein
MQLKVILIKWPTYNLERDESTLGLRIIPEIGSVFLFETDPLDAEMIRRDLRHFNSIITHIPKDLGFEEINGYLAMSMHALCQVT